MLEVLNLNENNCADCYKCIRTCSVKAITYANNTAEIVHDECILCGNCFVACPQKAKQVRNDVPRVKEAIAAGKHVVCSLAPSFIADFRIRSLDVMTDALKRLGFAEVQETAVGAQLVSDEYARIMREGKQRVLISSCCPSINMLIQKYYPTMLPHLAKVLTPMQAHCKAIKEQNPEAFTVFIGPCIAKKAEADESPYTDIALTYDELRDWLAAEHIELPTDHVEPGDGKRARFYPATGGVLKATDKVEGYRRIAIDGVDNCRAVFDELENSQFGNVFIEMSACEGSCINGPGMPHEKKGIITSRAMVEKIADFDIMLVSTEMEAFALECNLIKLHMPHYNILLKDDKAYPYIRVDLKDEFHFSYLFIAHDLSVVKHISDSLGVMYLGSIVERAPKKALFRNPVHPYTKALFSAAPTIDENNIAESQELRGEIPSPIHLPSGCLFHDRCPMACPDCARKVPELKEVEPGHFAACHLL